MQEQEPDAYRILNANSTVPLILTCEHASSYIPRKYNNLGLSVDVLDTHVARDKGCGRLTEMLAEKTGAAAFLANYSRLLIDYNRREHEQDLIVSCSDQTLIPGNTAVTPAERLYRLENYHRPYYRAVFAKIQELQNLGKIPIIFSIHGFTPQLKGGEFRPWNAGILYVKENAFATALLQNLQQYDDLKVEANVPYDMRLYNTGAAAICGEDKGFENAVIEIRDSEFDDIEHGATVWCEILGRFLHRYCGKE